MVRLANKEDIPLLGILLKKLYNKSNFNKLAPYNLESIFCFVENMILDDNYAIFVSEEEGELLGVIGCAVVPHYFNHEVLYGQDIFIYSENKDGKKLIEAYENWALSKGAKSVNIFVSESMRPKALGRMLEIKDYVLFEKIYSKELL